MSDTEKLPDPDTAWVEETKVRCYLLDLDHPEGRPKAEYFMRCGFTLEAWETMRDALVQQGVSNPVVKTTENEYGKRYVVECSCPTPDGSNPCIRSVWEVASTDKRPRLITAHAFK